MGSELKMAAWQPKIIILSKDKEMLLPAPEEKAKKSHTNSMTLQMFVAKIKKPDHQHLGHTYRG